MSTFCGDEPADRRVCSACIGEPYLRAEIERHGEKKVCSYCGARKKTWSIDTVADRVEKAFEEHYELTSDQPTAFESALTNDPDSNYNWEREGERTADAIGEALQTEPEIAEDVAAVLAERHHDFENDTMGVDSEFSEDAHYALKLTDDIEFQIEWNEFERHVCREARFFSDSAQVILRRIFADLDNQVTAAGIPVIVVAGPSKETTGFFRARVFQSKTKLNEALMRPDLKVSAPPHDCARPGRMNAAGISVFYGASTPEIAVAEVRPPVGSDVVTARFSLVRDMRLLDVEALEDVLVKGSLFDPTYRLRLEHAKFLKTISRRMSRVVMPDEEASGYLVTQVIADFLANVVRLDGLLYRSVQLSAAKGNVVLFHHACRTECMNLPKGSELTVSSHSGSYDDFQSDIIVYEDMPTAPEETSIASETGDLSSLINLEVDTRPITLKLDLDSVCMHHVAAATYETKNASVRRHRLKRKESD